MVAILQYLAPFVHGMCTCTSIVGKNGSGDRVAYLKSRGASRKEKKRKRENVNGVKKGGRETGREEKVKFEFNTYSPLHSYVTTPYTYTPA